MEVERLKKALEKLEDPRRTDGGHILHQLHIRGIGQWN